MVWGGSAVNVIGKSTVAGVVLPRNDGPVQVVFDAAATELSEKDCSIVKPSSMDQGNKVLFTDKANAPTIAFNLPAYLYVGDSATVKTTLTDADAVTRELTRDGKSCDMPEGFTKNGGLFYFMEAGRYTLKGTVENSGGVGSCEKTVEIGLTVEGGDPAAIRWELACDGKEAAATLSGNGGTLAFDGAGDYTLAAVAVDAQGREFSSDPISCEIVAKMPYAVTVTA